MVTSSNGLSSNARPGEFAISDAKRLLQAIDAALNGLPVEDRLHAGDLSYPVQFRSPCRQPSHSRMFLCDVTLDLRNLATGNSNLDRHTVAVTSKMSEGFFCGE